MDALIHLLKNHRIINQNNTLNVKFQSKLNENIELTQLIIDNTLFLEYSAPIKARLHCLIQGITTQPKCKFCDRTVTMRLSGRYRYTFPDYCSSKCLSNSSNVKHKRAETNLKKYGHTNSLQGQGVKEIAKQTLLQKYGVDNPLKDKNIQARIKQTNLERYGNESPLSSSTVREKIKQTLLQKYGVDNPLKDKNIQARIKQTNLERYGNENFFGTEVGQQKRMEGMIHNHGVKHPFQSPDIRAKMCKTMIERYNCTHGFQNEEIYNKFKHTMLVKYGKEHALQVIEFADAARNQCKETSIDRYGVPYFTQLKIEPGSLIKLNDKNWMEHQHIFLNKTFTKIAGELDVAHSTVGTYMKKYDITPQCIPSSQGERDLADFVKTLSDNVVTNSKRIIPPKELDIYLPDFNVAFEFNGLFWHSERNGKNKNYHLDKLNECKERGIRLIQVLDYEWICKPEVVKSRVSSVLQTNNTVYARNTKIVELDSNVCRDFFETNHIQGNAAASVCYGLISNDSIVAAMSFGKARFSKNHEWELIRYSPALFTNVVGGASKLFTHFLREKCPTSIVTYSDKRWNTGNLYIKLGFNFSHSAKPNYRYFLPSDATKLYHRSHFQKHKLQKLLPVFDPTLTEWENMQANGYDRIWDCGNDVFVWESAS